MKFFGMNKIFFLVLTLVEVEFYSVYIVFYSDFIYSLSQILIFDRTVDLYDPVGIKRLLVL